MAGTLTEKDIHNIPRCPHHGKGCVIKTGTKENATYGKSFFICNNMKEQCSFSKPAENIEKTECPAHHQMVELKSFALKADGLRCYYRCIYGKQNGGSWCGNVKLGGKKCEKLKDITNRQDIGTRNQPSKIKRDIDFSNTNKVNESSALPSRQTSNGDVVTCQSNEHGESQCTMKNTSKEKIYNEAPVVKTMFHIPSNAESTLDEHEFLENSVNKSAEINESSNVGIDQSKDCSSSFYDTSKAVFHVPRNTRISDISDASSHNSSRASSSSASLNGDSIVCEQVGNSAGGALSNTIEIVSSDDEAEGENLAISSKVDGREKSASYFTSDIQTLELNINKQKELLQKIGPLTNDNGQKLRIDIERLTKQLQQARIEQQNALHSSNANGTNIQPIGLVDKFPTMASRKVNQALPSMSCEQKSVINLGYDIPNKPHDNATAPIGRLAPVFGGRMTEKRLKEVGKMTKEAIEDLHKSLDTCPTGSEESEDPEHLKVSLMTHQRQALAWLLWRETQTPSGGILADDMGLGKTLTMISLTLKSKQKDLTRIKEAPKDGGLLFAKTTLIVCPASLVHQWYKEIENRVEKMQLRVCLYHGSNRETRVKKLAGYDIILTTYNIVSIEGKPFIQEEKDKSSKPSFSEWIDSTKPTKFDSGPLFKLFWRRIILDEGHTIKNYKTNISIAVSSLEAESRWIVTGTPIQNQTMDLYSLVKFLRVSPFDELKFWKHEVDNKTASGRKRMASIVNSLLLRRTKDQNDPKTGKPLVTLPKRSCVVHKLKLSKSETDVYELVQSFSKNMFTQFLDTRKDAAGHSSKQAPKPGDYEMPEEVLGMKVEQALTTLGLRAVNAVNAGCLLVLVLRLRQCCGHMSLMCEALDSDLCKSEGIEVPLEEQLGNMSIDERCSEGQNFRPKELKTTFQSTKVLTLLEKLKELQVESKGKKPIKSVVVSQWTRMLELIAYHLKRSGFKFDFITGSVNAKKRADIVENFNSDGDPQVMLVSLKAGGVGLNLIGGSHLFLIDQHWNPSLEDQACDRIYRVGQQNDVVIHRFLCLNTIEERIVQLQEKKKALANSVLYGGKTQKLSLDDLKTIFGITR